MKTGTATGSVTRASKGLEEPEPEVAGGVETERETQTERQRRTERGRDGRADGVGTRRPAAADPPDRERVRAARTPALVLTGSRNFSGDKEPETTGGGGPHGLRTRPPAAPHVCSAQVRDGRRRRLPHLRTRPPAAPRVCSVRVRSRNWGRLPRLRTRPPTAPRFCPLRVQARKRRRLLRTRGPAVAVAQAGSSAENADGDVATQELRPASPGGSSGADALRAWTPAVCANTRAGVDTCEHLWKILPLLRRGPGQGRFHRAASAPLRCPARRRPAACTSLTALTPSPVPTAATWPGPRGPSGGLNTTRLQSLPQPRLPCSPQSPGSRCQLDIIRGRPRGPEPAPR